MNKKNRGNWKIKAKLSSNDFLNGDIVGVRDKDTSSLKEKEHAL
jgi:hypothetical protein